MPYVAGATSSRRKLPAVTARRRVPIVYRGTRPLDLFLWGCCFYKTHLEAAKAPTLRLHLLGNEGVAIDPRDKALTHQARAEDNLPRDRYDRLAAALDDLRRLGDADLRINHPSRRKTPAAK